MSRTDRILHPLQVTDLNNCEAGFSLVELLYTLSISAVAILAVVTVLVNGYQSSANTASVAKSETSRRMVQMTLQYSAQQSLKRNLWLNQAVLTELGFPEPLKWSANITDTGTEGSMLSLANHVIANAVAAQPSALALASDAGSAFDLVAFIQKDPGARTLYVSSATPFQSFSSNTTSGHLIVSGDLTAYKAGNIIAVIGPNGTEFLKISSIAPPAISFTTIGTYTSMGSSVRMPSHYLPSGTIVFRPRVQIFGVEKTGDKAGIGLFEVRPGGASFATIFHENNLASGLALFVRHAKVHDSAGLVYPGGSTQAGAESLRLQIRWDRPSFNLGLKGTREMKLLQFL